MDSFGKKDCALDGAEEGINVAIRLRPLDSIDSATNSNARVWRVSQKYKSVTQTTAVGEPLERVDGRNFFTFDETFDEDASTRQVYNSVARGILQSVMGGLNGTIFAYGQTNSGKTYTMQGGGTIEEGSNNKGGIIHMAAQDIFSHISKDPQRVFLIRVSFIEIYNEEVRDLLVGDNDENVLTIREDPLRGVFVNATESFVTGYQSLLSTLFKGEKNRSFASTKMNERSSRSHTIFRINIESRKKPVAPCNDGIVSEEDNDDGAAVRISTLNLVDLAGSESVKHTNATGKRQREGGKINQSLLTLSRVIAALGSSNAFINFRDSKLTRILQPALSGNARMAIICCASPSDLYLNETRTSLQFASRAKLVKTRAKINEVLDDRSLIKKLQRELAFARRARSGSHTLSQFKALEIEAANANRKAEQAEKDLQRLKLSLLRGGLLHGFLLPQKGDQTNAERPITPYSSDDTYCNVTTSPKGQTRTHRRLSDSDINRTTVLMDQTNKQNFSFTSPKADCSKIDTLAKPKVRWMDPYEKRLVKCYELTILKEAFIGKAAIARSLKDKIVSHENAMRDHDDLLSRATERIALLETSDGRVKSEVVDLISNRKVLEDEKRKMIDTHAILLAEKDAKNQDAINAMENILADTENADSVLIPLRSQEAVRHKQDDKNKKLEIRIQELTSENSKILQQNRLLEQKNLSLQKENKAFNFDSKREEEVVEHESELDVANISTHNLEENALILSSTTRQFSTDLKFRDDMLTDVSARNENTELVDKIYETEDRTLDDGDHALESYEAEQNVSVLKLECSLEEASQREKALLSFINSIETSYTNQIQALNTKLNSVSSEKEILSNKVNGMQQELEILESKYNIVLTNLVEQEKSQIVDVQKIEEKYQSRIKALSNEISWISVEKESLSDRLVEIWESL